MRSWRSRLLVAAALGIAAAAPDARSTAPKNVSADARSLLIDGERVLLLGGAIHLPRVTPDDWDRVLSLAVEMGLNTVQTYFFWSFHQPARNASLAWDGPRDLLGFIRRAAAHGLWVTLRVQHLVFHLLRGQARRIRRQGGSRLGVDGGVLYGGSGCGDGRGGAGTHR